MNEIEHIGIAVKDLHRSCNIYKRLLNTECYKMETVESEGVLTAFFKTGKTKIELLEAINPQSPIASFINRRGEGVHHVAFSVTDIFSEMERLENEGFVPLNKIPKEGADGKLVCFLHPRDTGGVLIELCQDKNKS